MVDNWDQIKQYNLTSSLYIHSELGHNYFLLQDFILKEMLTEVQIKQESMNINKFF